MTVPLVVTDFDGTLTLEDLGNVLCDRFGDPGWRAVNDRWHRGELSLPEAQRQMWRQVRGVGLAELGAFALERSRLRPGADELFAAAAEGRIELVVASGGFDFYIEAILGAHLDILRARYHNRLVETVSGVEPVFLRGLECSRCAVCKCRVLTRHAGEGRRLVFCGDGGSDRCAAGVAPELFVVEGSRLAAHCEAERVPYVPFRDFATVLDALVTG